MACRAGQALRSVIKDDSTGYTEYRPKDESGCMVCCGMCCLKGCVLGVLAALFFFVFLPAGVLLLYHGVNHGRALTLALGCTMLLLPVVVGMPTIVFYRWRTLRRKDHKQMVRARKKGQENPVATVIQDEDL